jgi:hypothetical protein
MCAICLYIGCFKVKSECHIEAHSIKEDHNVFVDIIYGYIYCYKCKDFQYNEKIEDLFRKFLNKSGILPFGKFQLWEPSQSILRLLKNFVKQSSTKNKEEPTSLLLKEDNSFIIQLLKLKSSSIIGLRGLLNLGNTVYT